MKKIFLILLLLLVASGLFGQYVAPYKIIYSSETPTATFIYAGQVEVGISTTTRYVIFLGSGTIRGLEGVITKIISDDVDGVDVSVLNIFVSDLETYTYQIGESTDVIKNMLGAKLGDIIWHDGSEWVKLSTTNAAPNYALMLFVSSISWGTVAAGAAGVANPMTENLDLGNYDTYDGDHGSYDTLLATTSGKFAGMSITNDGAKTTFLGKSGDYNRIGDAGVAVGLNNEDDLLVTDDLEVLGLTRVYGILYTFDEIRVIDQKPIVFGTTQDSKIVWRTEGNDSLRLMTKANSTSYSGNIIISTLDGEQIDFGHSVVADPHWRIQSTNEADTNEYVQFFSSSVDGGNGYIETGKDLVITAAGGDVYVNANIRADAYEMHASSFFLHSLPNISSTAAVNLIENIKDGSKGLLDKSSMGVAYIPAHEKVKIMQCRTLIDGSTWQYELTTEEIRIQEEAVTSMPVLWSAMIKMLQSQQTEIQALKSEIGKLKP